MPATNPPGAGLRVMYDAVTPSNIPAEAQMVAGYVDGRYAWSSADWARFPGAVKVKIAVFPSTNDGHVLDVERGNATPAEAPGWVLKRRAAGVDPTVYCSATAWPTVRAAFAAAHVPEPHWWIAAYPGIGAILYPGTVAHQYADQGLCDLSVVADYWPGVDKAPSTTTSPGADMTPDQVQDAPIQIGTDAHGKPVTWSLGHVLSNIRGGNSETQLMIGQLAALIGKANSSDAALQKAVADLQAKVAGAVIVSGGTVTVSPNNQGGTAPSGV